MSDTRLGTLKGWGWFKCPVYIVDYELPGRVAAGSDIVALHSGRFWSMKIRIERKWMSDPRLDEFLHHEHMHAIGKSTPWLLFRTSRKREKIAKAYAKAMKGKPVPWL